MTPKIAVLLPCYNEELTIGDVVRAFRDALPDAEIYVYDNNSRDRTREKASEAGAIVKAERLQGKGNVVRRMFADIEADIYVMADGDGTYDAAAAPEMAERLRSRHLDMVVGARKDSREDGLYRPGHRLGNRMLTWFGARIFGRNLEDMLSGYRVMSRRFVKSFPALSRGFEIETELTMHALHLRLPITESDTKYAARPDGSDSKLNTWRDGFRIFLTITLLFKEARPFLFFTIMSALLALISFGVAWPVIVEFLETGLVPRLPTAILATGIMILAYTSFICGIVLDSVGRGRLEAKRLAYLMAAQSAPDDGGAEKTD